MQQLIRSKQGCAPHAPLMKKSAGFTILEMLMYIALFSIIMVGALGGAYQIIESSVKIRTKLVLNQEAHFIFRKIDWALNGAKSADIDLPDFNETRETLLVDKGSDTYEFELSPDERLMLNDEPLTASGIKVEDFTVIRGPINEYDGIRVSFILNGKEFAESVRYIR